MNNERAIALVSEKHVESAVLAAQAQLCVEIRDALGALGDEPETETHDWATDVAAALGEFHDEECTDFDGLLSEIEVVCELARMMLPVEPQTSDEYRRLVEVLRTVTNQPRIGNEQS